MYSLSYSLSTCLLLVLTSAGFTTLPCFHLVHATLSSGGAMTHPNSYNFSLAWPDGVSGVQTATVVMAGFKVTGIGSYLSFEANISLAGESASISLVPTVSDVSGAAIETMQFQVLGISSCAVGKIQLLSDDIYPSGSTNSQTFVLTPNSAFDLTSANASTTIYLDVFIRDLVMTSLSTQFVSLNNVRMGQGTAEFQIYSSGGLHEIGRVGFTLLLFSVQQFIWYQYSVHPHLISGVTSMSLSSSQLNPPVMEAADCIISLPRWTALTNSNDLKQSIVTLNNSVLTFSTFNMSQVVFSIYCFLACSEGEYMNTTGSVRQCICPSDTSYVNNSACLQCSQFNTGCLTCSFVDPTFICNSCNQTASYFLSGSLCQACVLTNCDSCLNLTYCASCSEGYNIDSTGTCVRISNPYLSTIPCLSITYATLQTNPSMANSSTHTFQVLLSETISIDSNVSLALQGFGVDGSLSDASVSYSASVTSISETTVAIDIQITQGSAYSFLQFCVMVVRQSCSTKIALVSQRFSLEVLNNAGGIETVYFNSSHLSQDFISLTSSLYYVPFPQDMTSSSARDIYVSYCRLSTAATASYVNESSREVGVVITSQATITSITVVLLAYQEDMFSELVRYDLSGTLNSGTQLRVWFDPSATVDQSLSIHIGQCMVWIEQFNLQSTTGTPMSFQILNTSVGDFYVQRNDISVLIRVACLLSCRPGTQYISYGGKYACLACMEGCTCNVTNNCTGCLPAYYQSAGNCQSCVSSCRECSLVRTNCTACYSGSYLRNSLCQHCNYPCLTCIETEFNCTNCANSFYLESVGSCRSYLEGCLHCSNDVSCFICSTGYILNQSVCYNITSHANISQQTSVSSRRQDHYTLSLVLAVLIGAMLITLIFILCCAYDLFPLCASKCKCIYQCCFKRQSRVHDSSELPIDSFKMQQPQPQEICSASKIDIVRQTSSLEIQDTTPLCVVCLQVVPNCHTKCGHNFHGRCLKEATRKKHSCPSCKEVKFNPVTLYCGQCGRDSITARLEKISESQLRKHAVCYECSILVK